MPVPVLGTTSPGRSEHHGLALPRELWHGQCPQCRSPGQAERPWLVPVSPGAPPGSSPVPAPCLPRAVIVQLFRAGVPGLFVFQKAFVEK